MPILSEVQENNMDLDLELVSKNKKKIIVKK